MEKQWVEDVKKCPQYEYGLLHPYIEKFDFEDETDLNDADFYGSDSSDDGYTIENAAQTVIQFLKQVRESRGYDVDISVPRRFCSPFRPVDLDELELESYKKYVMRGFNVVVKNINEESKKVTGKIYEFVEMKKIVETTNLMLLFTFTARVRNAEAIDAGAEAKDAGADAKDAGADAKDAGTDARDAGAEARDAGAEAKDAGADAKDDGAVKTLQAMVYVPFGSEPEFIEWRVKPVPDATEGVDRQL